MFFFSPLAKFINKIRNSPLVTSTLSSEIFGANSPLRERGFMV